VVGILILALSFAFFLVYVLYVYRISPNDAGSTPREVPADAVEVSREPPVDAVEVPREPPADAVEVPR
jgi:hypothetical protein